MKLQKCSGNLKLEGEEMTILEADEGNAVAEDIPQDGAKEKMK